MEQILNDLIKDILLKNQDKLAIPMKKRSKFEGWLKIELAGALAKKYTDTEVEYACGKKHIDIYSNKSFIELKTPSTNYQHVNIIPNTRPITDNINGIIDDVKKLHSLRLSPRYGYIAFALYPLDANKLYQNHIDRITTYIQNNYSKSKIVETTERINGIETLIYTAKVM